MQTTVAVVVPIYSVELSELDLISYKQLCNVLGNYPILIVLPNSLDISVVPILNNSSLVRFPDEHFTSVESYSRLCMTYEFYRTFSDYDYILIYQLDAFVFSDRLSEFCDKGYDYIGAPTPPSSWKGLPYNVGNGGFSLRKISSFLRVTERVSDILYEFKKEYGSWIGDNSIYGMEDCFFGYCGYKKDIDFSVPSVEEAFEFSIEFNINGIYKNLRNHLPFGCHRWHSYRFLEWWQIINCYGYDISWETRNFFASKYQWHEYRVLMHYLENKELLQVIKTEVLKIIGSDSIRIWGMGKEGRTIVRSLQDMGFYINTKYDKSYDVIEGGIEPTARNILDGNTPLIVTTTKYEIEIENYLSELSLEKNVDYFAWKDIVAEVTEKMGINQEGDLIRK